MQQASRKVWSLTLVMESPTVYPSTMVRYSLVSVRCFFDVSIVFCRFMFIKDDLTSFNAESFFRLCSSPLHHSYGSGWPRRHQLLSAAASPLWVMYPSLLCLASVGIRSPSNPLIRIHLFILLSSTNFTTSVEMQTVREIKQKLYEMLCF